MWSNLIYFHWQKQIASQSLGIVACGLVAKLTLKFNLNARLL